MTTQRRRRVERARQLRKLRRIRAFHSHLIAYLKSGAYGCQDYKRDDPTLYAMPEDANLFDAVNELVRLARQAGRK